MEPDEMASPDHDLAAAPKKNPECLPKHSLSDQGRIGREYRDHLSNLEQGRHRPGTGLGPAPSPLGGYPWHQLH